MYWLRELKLPKWLATRSVLLLGPRRTGKSSLIRNELQVDRTFNLLESDTFLRLSARPSLIRETLRPSDRLIAIDEIQKAPQLMDEVHSMIESNGPRFILTGSSARKLMRTHTQLMGGRAQIVRLHPFAYSEIPNFDLDRTLTFGTMPFSYLSEQPWNEIEGYASDYVREEIAAEGLSRKIEQFSRFLEVAALSHTLELNYEEVGRDAQAPARTVRDYYAILEDTLFGETIFPFRKKIVRKPSAHGKFYFFDISVPHALLRVKQLQPGTTQYSASFEHLVFRELRTYRDYRSRDLGLSFYRDVSKREIDFLLNDEIGIEVKSGAVVHDRDLKHLFSVGNELKLKRQIVVCRERFARKVGSIEILPVHEFLAALWADQIVPR